VSTEGHDCEGEPNFARRFEVWFAKFGDHDDYAGRSRDTLMENFCADCQEEDAIEAANHADPNTDDNLSPHFVCENNPRAGKSKRERGIWEENGAQVMHDGYAGAHYERHDRRRLDHLRGGRRLRFPDNSGNVPNAFDWTERGYDFAVQNQGWCGSCWSFSSAEGAQGGALAAGIKVELSVEWAYNCSVGLDRGDKNIKTLDSVAASGYREGDGWAIGADVHGGCDWGGMMDFFYNVLYEGHDGSEGYHSDSFHWPLKTAADNNGFSYSGSDDGWNLSSRNQKCDGYSAADSVHVKGYYIGLAYDTNQAIALERQKKEWVVKYGVLSIAICASPAEFNDYSGGIVHGQSCTRNYGCRLDHAVATVGYGTEGGLDFWRIKNSWGEYWGDNGYIRVVREQNCLGLGEETIGVIVGRNSDTTPSPSPTPSPTPSTTTTEAPIPDDDPTPTTWAPVPDDDTPPTDDDMPPIPDDDMPTTDDDMPPTDDDMPPIPDDGTNPTTWAPIPDDDMPPIPDDDMPPIPDDGTNPTTWTPVPDDDTPTTDDGMPPTDDDMPPTDDDNVPSIPDDDDPMPPAPIDYYAHCDAFNQLKRNKARKACNGDRFPAGSETRVCIFRQGSCQTIEMAVSNIFTSWLDKKWGEKRIKQWCGHWSSTDAVQEGLCSGSNKGQCRSTKEERQFCQWRKGGCDKKFVGRLFDMTCPTNQQMIRDSWCYNAARRADENILV
jgi:hypothetical protein